VKSSLPGDEAADRYGGGEAVVHQGGRLIWQLPNVERLLTGWETLDVDQATAREVDLFRELITSFGQLPFANLRH
jgi:hypothetical protein